MLFRALMSIFLKPEPGLEVSVESEIYAQQLYKSSTIQKVAYHLFGLGRE